MTLLNRLDSVSRAVPRSERQVPTWVVLVSVPAVVAVVALGVWVTGAVVTQDATTAMLLTGGWFGLAGVLALVVVLRWRALVLPVLLTYAVSAAAIGGFLLYTSTVDQVVDEVVVVALPAPTPATAAQQPSAAVSPVAAAAGTFRPQAHETQGKATLVVVRGGSRVLTLTGFETAPGPDLRVYLVPGDGSSTSDAVDLGRLKGNKGDQQYPVPTGAPAGAVVIWCRAFSVAFGTATLS